MSFNYELRIYTMVNDEEETMLSTCLIDKASGVGDGEGVAGEVVIQVNWRDM